MRTHPMWEFPDISGDCRCQLTAHIFIVLYGDNATAKAAKKAKAAQKTERKEKKKVHKSKDKYDSEDEDDQDLEAILEKV